LRQPVHTSVRTLSGQGGSRSPAALRQRGSAAHAFEPWAWRPSGLSRPGRGARTGLPKCGAAHRGSGSRGTSPAKPAQNKQQQAEDRVCLTRSSGHARSARFSPDAKGPRARKTGLPHWDLCPASPSSPRPFKENGFASLSLCPANRSSPRPSSRGFASLSFLAQQAVQARDPENTGLPH